MSKLCLGIALALALELGMCGFPSSRSETLHLSSEAIFGALSLALCPYAWRVYCAASSLAKQAAEGNN